MHGSELESLLESFAKNALGLELRLRILDTSLLPPDHRRWMSEIVGTSTAWAAWHSDQGIVTMKATYDEIQAHRTKAHVLLLDWWIRLEHFKSTWYCYPKFPGDWIKGDGSR